MSDSAPATRPRIVPAIPLNFSKPPSAKVLATPEGSSSSGLENRQENAVVNGASVKSVQTAPQHAPLTPESKSSTPAHGDHVQNGSTELSYGSQREESGQRKDHVLPATPISNGDSHSPTRDRRNSYTKDVAEGQSGSGPKERPPSSVSNGMPAFSPQRGTYRLPPPFYPSEKSSSPISKSHTSQVEQTSSDTPSNMHHPRPNAMSLVFGGMPDSSSSSPVPFTPSGASQYQIPPVYPSTFTGNVNAAPFYPSVAMPPFSEAQVDGGYTPMTATAPSFSPFVPSQPWLPPGASFHYAVPAAAMPIQFGQPLSPSLSQHSSAKAGHDRRASQQGSSEGLMWQQTDVLEASSRPGTGQESVRDSAWAEEQPHPTVTEPSLEGHILSQFGKYDYADCILEVYLTNEPDAPLRFPGHRLLMVRSPRLAAELATGSAMAEFDHHGFRVLRLWAPSRFATSSAIIEALSYLYGAPVEAKKTEASAEEARQSSEEAKERLTHALSCVAAGSILELPEYAQHALEDAFSLLCFHTVEQALSFALDKSQTADISGSSFVEAEVPTEGSDGRPNGGIHEESATSYEGQLLDKTLEFLIQNFPDDFSLDTAAAQLIHTPRLPPSLVSSRPSVSDPRFSRIKFGDINGEAPTEEKHVSGVISSILLSLPFSTLERLLGVWGRSAGLSPTKPSELMQAVIDERERRRLKALRASRSSKHAHSKRDSGVWENLYWEERVDDSKLSRTRKQDDNATDVAANK
ncbi:hypothetical protein NA57DRAFT_76686 [Rhizodiscina lignyota]|uniref:BTB domain-containing protein n=1 Tax=Rhizodiscina lignyota TaxID=1504668 RepID=A0A9P4M4M8_9PEZI|nr:hypothetical protein NA57DRAFT_76686 [Rhizodiscina lignyota]